MVDKEWTKFSRFSKEYIDGVELFLDFACTNGRPQGIDDFFIYWIKDGGQRVD